MTAPDPEPSTLRFCIPQMRIAPLFFNDAAEGSARIPDPAKSQTRGRCAPHPLPLTVSAIATDAERVVAMMTTPSLCMAHPRCRCAKIPRSPSTEHGRDPIQSGLRTNASTSQIAPLCNHIMHIIDHIVQSH